jgi:SAM-dependent methyltransferase
VGRHLFALSAYCLSQTLSSPTKLGVVTDLPEHVVRNRAYWDGLAPEYAERGRDRWAQAEPSWGIWGVPESELRILPPSPGGLDVIELGCGTAYVSAWLARRGARPVGIDNSEAQLVSARGGAVDRLTSSPTAITAPTTPNRPQRR